MVGFVLHESERLVLIVKIILRVDVRGIGVPADRFRLWSSVSCRQGVCHVTSLCWGQVTIRTFLCVRNRVRVCCLKKRSNYPVYHTFIICTACLLVSYPNISLQALTATAHFAC